VYRAYPFVLSWSLQDVMACAALIVGSDTPPVRDLSRHRENGLLAGFFDLAGLSRTLIEACREPDRFVELRRSAKAVVSGYHRESVCLPRWRALIEEVAARGGRNDGLWTVQMVTCLASTKRKGEGYFVHRNAGTSRKIGCDIASGRFWRSFYEVVEKECLIHQVPSCILAYLVMTPSMT
jgi:hypothetical protein